MTGKLQSVTTMKQAAGMGAVRAKKVRQGRSPS